MRRELGEAQREPDPSSDKTPESLLAYRRRPQHPPQPQHSFDRVWRLLRVWRLFLKEREATASKPARSRLGETLWCKEKIITIPANLRRLLDERVQERGAGADSQRGRGFHFNFALASDDNFKGFHWKLRVASLAMTVASRRL